MQRAFPHRQSGNPMGSVFSNGAQPPILHASQRRRAAALAQTCHGQRRWSGLSSRHVGPGEE